MHDFIQSCYNPHPAGSVYAASVYAFRLTTTTAFQPMPWIMRSFNEAPLPFTAYRPVPAPARKRAVRSWRKA